MGKKKGRRLNNDGCLMPFRYVLNAAMTAGTAALVVSPALTARATTEADAWAHFRVRKLRFRLHPRAVLSAVGYVGGVQDTTPSSVAQIVELIPSTYIAGNTTIPSSWVSVPQKDLAGPFPWYKTVAGGADPTEEAPGVICIGGTSTDAFSLEFEVTFEFKTSVATANTPVALQLRERVRSERIMREFAVERNRLLKILGVSPTALTSL